MNIQMIVSMILLVIVGVARANTTYVLNQYPTYQVRGGVHYNLIGTITTDGTIGALSPSNIVSWQFTTAAEDGSRTVTFTSGSTYSDLSITGQVIATATEIQIPRFATITPNVINNLTLTDKDPAITAVPDFVWQTGAFLDRPVLSEQFGFAGTRAFPFGDPWLASSNANTTLSLPSPTGPIIVATVPEPASLGLLGLGAAGLLGRKRTWKTQGKRDGLTLM